MDGGPTVKRPERNRRTMTRSVPTNPKPTLYRGKTMHSSKLIRLAPLLILASCQSPTTPTTTTVDGVPTTAQGSGVVPPKVVLCSLDPAIHYAAPKPGEADDATNHLDRDKTVGDDKNPARGTIRYHNAVVGAACK